MKTPKLTSAQKLAFYKENGYWFGTTPKATISATTKEINREEVFAVQEVKMMTASERVAVEEMNIAMRVKAIKSNL